MNKEFHHFVKCLGCYQSRWGQASLKDGRSSDMGQVDPLTSTKTGPPYLPISRSPSKSEANSETLYVIEPKGLVLD